MRGPLDSVIRASAFALLTSHFSLLASPFALLPSHFSLRPSRFALLTSLLASSTAATWRVELGLGSAVSLPAPIVIRQQNEPDIRFTGRFLTRPFAEVPYYSIRVGHASWGFEVLHHKLYLANHPDEVERFQASHGYNLLLGNRVWQLRSFALRAGAGVVMPHPENTVRGARLDEGGGILGTGWYFAGPCAQLAIGKHVPLGRLWSLGLEGKVTAAFARVPVARGNADIPNFALHGLVVLGRRFQ